MIKSPLRYPGGKSRALKMIVPLITPFDEFREPFVGGASVFLYLKQCYPAKHFWINDIYTELYFFWEAAQNNIDGLIAQINTWRKAFQRGKDLYQFLNQSFSTFTNIERAAAFFIYNRITFSGTSLSGGFSEAAFKGRFTESSLLRLQNTARILAHTKITNMDYAEVVEAQGKNVFLFLDPPYYTASKSALYGKNGHLHKFFDHERFAHIMKNCTHRWLITYDDCDYIRRLFSFAHVRAWHFSYGMRNVSKHSTQVGKELFISNYDITQNQCNSPISQLNYKQSVML